MLALVAAVIFLLHGLAVLDNTADVNWLLVGLAFWAAHFAFGAMVPWPWNRGG
jgi:hypothetical protein